MHTKRHHRKHQTSLKLLFLSVGLTLLLGARAEARPLRFGVVPQVDKETLHASWRPILDEITKSTGLEFELVLDKDFPSFEARLRKGELDIAYCNAYQALVARQKLKYEPVLTDSNGALTGILVVRKDSRIANVKALQGATIAFPAPNALAASLAMRAQLKRDEKLDIKPLYVKTHDEVYRAVVEGRAMAGGGVHKSLNSQPPEIRDQLSVLYTTKSIPSHPVVVHPAVEKAIVEKVQKGFLALGETEEGRKLLASVPFKKIAPGTIADYRALMWWGLQDFYVEGGD